MAGTVESLREKNLVEQFGKVDRKKPEARATEDIKVSIEKAERTEPLPLATYEKGTARG